MEMQGRIEFKGDTTIKLLQEMLLEAELAGISVDAQVNIHSGALHFTWEAESS